ncbi:bifunctional hydroxymethylpyrimidine kinase/phosphomethylpyrimidine kinase, partial [Francisella tularensis subsp. holarctica]|uniref:bifunctional hydroxymethylpyrimidine kinase/phosphomethylpyrimidine kinase n=1 Tax=Francisella tularensis TaxID=263 RepID=UPI0023819C80
DSLYCCDPVFGDKHYEDENGHIFASSDHPNIFLSHLLPLADIITPNLFEISVLSGSQICNYDDIITACQKLISKTGNHNPIIIVTRVSLSQV